MQSSLKEWCLQTCFNVPMNKIIYDEIFLQQYHLTSNKLFHRIRKFYNQFLRNFERVCKQIFTLNNNFESSLQSWRILQPTLPHRCIEFAVVISLFFKSGSDRRCDKYFSLCHQCIKAIINCYTSKSTTHEDWNTTYVETVTSTLESLNRHKTH